MPLAGHGGKGVCTPMCVHCTAVGPRGYIRHGQEARCHEWCALPLRVSVRVRCACGPCTVAEFRTKGTLFVAVRTSCTVTELHLCG